MASAPGGSGSPRSALADTVLVSADQLLRTPLLYIDRYYPLREAEWVRLRQVSAWWTAVGAVLGFVLTTVVPMARQYVTGAGIPYESTLDLIIEAGLLVLAFLMSWVFDRRKRASVRKISDYFRKDD
jgi:hypothetical protein